MKRQRLLRATLPVVLVAAVLVPVDGLARIDGIATGATDCAPCHGSSPTGSVNVSISGPITLGPNQTGTYTLTIDEALAGGALNIAITGGSGTLGTIAPNLDNVKVLGDELTHVDSTVSPPNGNLGLWVYNFTVTAPGTIGETITVAALGMQYNGDFSNDAGDVWNSATPLGISVVPEPGTATLLGLGLVGLAVSGRGRRRR